VRSRAHNRAQHVLCRACRRCPLLVVQCSSAEPRWRAPSQRRSTTPADPSRARALPSTGRDRPHALPCRRQNADAIASHRSPARRVHHARARTRARPPGPAGRTRRMHAGARALWYELRTGRGQTQLYSFIHVMRKETQKLGRHAREESEDPSFVMAVSIGGSAFASHVRVAISVLRILARVPSCPRPASHHVLRPPPARRPV
jgi:hypothetical protein